MFLTKKKIYFFIVLDVSFFKLLGSFIIDRFFKLSKAFFQFKILKLQHYLQKC
jgi:hypothetical protein